VSSIKPADLVAAAHEQLTEIREDPGIKRLARRYSGHPDLADDALQRTYYILARLENLEQIKNLRAYFCKVLIREVHRERGQLGAALVEDFTRVVEARQDAGGPVSPSSVDDTVGFSLQARSWLKRLADERDGLLAAIPARSDDPDRYRAVIYAAAEQVLRDGINAEPSDADTDDAFRAAYPEYFDQPDRLPNTLYQRFHRARDDVKDLLQAIVNRGELF
jgi:DNA-directed RNA polymerase specialized sigma24 family protein